MAVCPECGGTLAGGKLEGLCLKCLMEEGCRILAASNKPSEASQPEQVFRNFGDYQLLEEIARGGMGVVYRARQKSLDRTVAVKTLALGPHASQGFVKRLRAEAMVAAGLHHPNIVAIHEVGVHQGEHYLVMDFVDGPDLAQFIKNQPLQPPRAAGYMKPVAEAIHYAHEHGVLHRDLKPSNVLIGSDDKPRVTDFGLARRLEGESSLTVSGQVVGSPSYMPPEQAAATRHMVGRRSDVYSLGAMLYHMLTGRPPFVGEDLSQTLSQVLNQDPAPPRVLNPAVPRDLETICLKCLEKEPAGRYRTALELAEDLGHFLQNEPILARPVGLAGRIWRWCRRKPVMASLIVLVHLVGALGLGGILWQWRQAEQARNNEARLRQRAEARAYASDMNLVQQALAVNNLGRARTLLNRHRPAANGLISERANDLRGWEWRYLWRACRGDARFTLCQKSNEISSLASSFDGKWLAVGEHDYGGLSIWDLEARREIQRLAAGDGYVFAAFSPREPLLAFSAITSRSSPHCRDSVRLWDGTTKKILAELTLGGQCRGLAFSDDGQTLVTSAEGEDQIALWEVHGGTKRASYSAPQDWTDDVPVLAVTGDLSVAAHGMKGGDLRVLDLATGKARWQAKATDEHITSLAYSPDGRVLASGAGFTETAIRLRDATSGKEIARLQGPRGYALSLVFWPDGKTLASASADHSIYLWDLRDLVNVPPPRTLLGDQKEVFRLALLPDNRTLVSGSQDGSVYVWETVAGQGGRMEVTMPEAFNCLDRAWQLPPDSQSLLAVERQGRVTQWQGPDFQQAQTLLELGTNIGGASISDDGRLVAAGSGEGIIRVWDLPGQRLLRQFTVSGGQVVPWTFAERGRKLLIHDLQSEDLHEWDLTKGYELRSWHVGGDLREAGFSQDGRWFFAVTWNFPATLSDMRTSPVRERTLDLKDVWHAAISPNGKLIGAASGQGRARLWETETLREIYTLSDFLEGGTGMTFSPDGTRLITGSEGEAGLKLWDVQSHEGLLTLPQPPRARRKRSMSGFSIQFSPDGNVLGAMNPWGVLRLWRAPSWQEIGAAEKSESQRR